MTNKLTTEEFIYRAVKIHGTNYDYSLVDYDGDKNKVIIICKIHGPFTQIAGNHIYLKHGCKECKFVKLGNRKRKPFAEFVKKANEIHNNSYDYSNFKYINNKIPGIIICSIHGEFEKTPVSHIQKKRGCPACTEGYYPKKTTSEFTTEANSVHDNIYAYSNSKYTGAFNKVEIICKEHGSFNQIAKDHTTGKGCPTCAINNKMGKENELIDFLKADCGIINIISHDRCLISPKELDIIIPEKNIAIEYCGLRWHSENFGNKSRSYHRNKTVSCLDRGIMLFTIFGDEWEYRNFQVKNYIKGKLGALSSGDAARKCDIRIIDNTIANSFVDAYHIQGVTNSVLYSIGAFDKNNNLVGVIQLGNNIRKRNDDSISLKRMCFNDEYHAGLATRMFKYVKNNITIDTIITFSDNRWSTGEIYESMGFAFDGNVDPDFKYLAINSKKLENKSKYRKSKLLKYNGVDARDSEWIIMQKMGRDRMWDCGKRRYIWKR